MRESTIELRVWGKNLNSRKISLIYPVKSAPLENVNSVCLFGNC